MHTQGSQTARIHWIALSINLSDMLSVCLVRWICAGVAALPSLPLKIFHTWWLDVLVVTHSLIYSYLLLLHPATHSHAMHAFPVCLLKAECRVWLVNTPCTCTSTWHMYCSVRWVAAPVPPVSAPSARHPSMNFRTIDRRSSSLRREETWKNRSRIWTEAEN